MIDCFATRNSFQVDAQGKISPCCKFKGNFSDASEYASVFDIMTDARLQHLRERHALGEWTKSCVRCQQDESTSKQSRRQMYDNIGLTPTDFFIDISLGNFCNLKCRMCSPENSTQWHSDYRALQEENLVSAVEYKNYLMDSDTIAMIADHIDRVYGRIVIEIKGGEPLLMPNSREFFDRISNTKHVEQIEIWIASNGTKIPEWFEDCISKFKKVELSISVDGTDNVYSYIRGGKHPYEDVLQNALVLSRIKNVDLRFNIVVQNLNIRNVSVLYEDLFNLVKDHNKITLIILRFPEYYQCNIYPDDKKLEILNEWENSLISKNSSFNGMRTLFVVENNTNVWNTFKQVTKILDSRRNQNILEIDECLKI